MQLSHATAISSINCERFHPTPKPKFRILSHHRIMKHPPTNLLREDVPREKISQLPSYHDSMSPLTLDCKKV